MADPQMSLKELQAEVERLSKLLQASEVKRTDAEEMAHQLAASSHYLGSHSQEQPTGKTVTRTVCLNPHVRDEKKHKYHEVELPTYFINIQLPPGACGTNGSCLSTNGIEYHHGTTHEVDPDTLRELKSRIARCWEHERSIKGENENIYKKKTSKHFVTSRAMQAGYA